MSDNNIYIKKSSGELEIFDELKLKKSLINSNATTLLANDIIDQIKLNLKPHTSSSEIYKTAFNILKKKEKRISIRYSLRRSLLTLGPTGFPFERFIAAIFNKKGYKTMVGINLKGKCIDHEIDVLGYDNDDLILNEVKFHNDLHTKTDTKVTLYVKARFDDLKDTEIELDGKKRKFTSGTIITNTKFTENAIKYAQCAGLELISFDYPEKGNLFDLMEETKLHPITTITNLTLLQKEKLINADIITCSDLKEKIDYLKNIETNPRKIKLIMAEVNEICSY